MRWLLCAGIFLSFSGVARAEEQFWVAVGSYRDRGYAEEARDKANAALNEAYTVSSIDIDTDRWYRVLTGPYVSRGVAELTLVEAQQAGFESTWMLAGDPVDAGLDDQDSYADYDRYGDDEASDEYSEYGDYSEYEEYARLPDYESSYPPLESDQPPAATTPQDDTRRAAKIPSELVDEAPAGYGLHKLRRHGDE